MFQIESIRKWKTLWFQTERKYYDEKYMESHIQRNQQLKNNKRSDKIKLITN